MKKTVGQIYPTEFQLNKADSSDTNAPFLDLNLSTTNDIVSSKIYDKRDYFNFELEQLSMVHHRKYPLFLPITFSLGVKVTQNEAQYLLHNVSYASVKFEVAMSNG